MRRYDVTRIRTAEGVGEPRPVPGVGMRPLQATGFKEEMKQQVIIVHGADAFKTRKAYIAHLKRSKLDYKRLLVGGWKENLVKVLGKKFEVVLLRMPNPLNARYEEWEIVFNKVLPFLRNKPILVGHSMGGIFLAKYLSKHRFPKRILATILVAAPFNGAHRGEYYSLVDFALPKSLKGFATQGGKIFIYQSKDDPTVPFANAERYKQAIPSATIVWFQHKGHFSQWTFPELARHIRKIAR